MQDTLLHEVCSRIDDVMAFSIKMQQSQIPKLTYLIEIGKKTFLTYFIPRLQTFELHLMYKNRDSIHEVEEQQGCKLYFDTKETRIFLTILIWGLKIETILIKIGAHIGARMGRMVQDFTKGIQISGLIFYILGFLPQQIRKITLESLLDDIKKRPKITIDNRSKAEDWLIEFLEGHYKENSNFYDRFKLKNVIYKETYGKKINRLDLWKM